MHPRVWLSQQPWRSEARHSFAYSLLQLFEEHAHEYERLTRPGPLKIGIQIRAGDGLLGDIAINLDTYRPFFNCADQLEVRFAAGTFSGRQGFHQTSAITLDTRQLFFPRANQLEAVQTRANVTIAGVIRPAPAPRGEAGGGGKQEGKCLVPISCWHQTVQARPL